MYKRVEYETTYQCNLKCIHCYVPSLREKMKNANLLELTTDESYSLIDQIFLLEIPEIHFTGGEPLLKKDIIKLLNYSHTKGLRTFLETNGTLINKEKAKQIKNSGIECVKISIDGPAEVFAKIRGKKIYEKTIRGINNIVKVDQNIEIDTDLSKINKDCIANIIDLSNELNVNSFRIRLVLPICENSLYDGLILSPEEIYNVYKIIQEKKQQYKDKLSIFDDLLLNESIERFFINCITINPYGYIRPYPFSSLVIGNIRNEKINKLLEIIPETLPKIKKDVNIIQNYFDRIQNYLVQLK